MSEEILIRQAAPTLAGIKTGSLFPCPCDDREELLADIRRLNRLLVPKGLCLLPIRFLEGQVLLYLYRPQDLCRDLQNEQALEILQHAGYSSVHCAVASRTSSADSARAASSPMRSGCFSPIRRRMSRALSTTAPATSSVQGCGRSTATRRRRASCSRSSKNVRRSTVRFGRRARASSSLPWQCDKFFKRERTRKI